MAHSMDEQGRSRPPISGRGPSTANIKDILDRLEDMFESCDGNALSDEAGDNIADWYGIAASVTGLISNAKGRDAIRIQSAVRDSTELETSLAKDFLASQPLLRELRLSVVELGPAQRKSPRWKAGRRKERRHQGRQPSVSETRS